MKTNKELFLEFVKKHEGWNGKIDDIIVVDDKVFVLLNNDNYYSSSSMMDEIKRFSVGFGIDKLFLVKEYLESPSYFITCSGTTFTNVIY